MSASVTASATAPVVPAGPGIELVKSVAAVNDVAVAGSVPQVKAGDTVRFEFTVTNTGGVTLAPVTVSDPKLGISDAACVDSLAPGESATCSTTGEYVVTQADIAAGVTIENVAAVSGGVPGTTNATTTVAGSSVPASATTHVVPTSPAAPVETPTDPLPGGGILVEKLIDMQKVATVTPGESVDVTIRVTNPGPVDLLGVTVADRTIYGNREVTDITCGEVGGTEIGRLAVGETVTCTGKLVLETGEGHADVAGAIGHPTFVPTTFPGTTVMSTVPGTTNATTTVGASTVPVTTVPATTITTTGLGTPVSAVDTATAVASATPGVTTVTSTITEPSTTITTTITRPCDCDTPTAPSIPSEVPIWPLLGLGSLGSAAGSAALGSASGSEVPTGSVPGLPGVTPVLPSGSGNGSHSGSEQPGSAGSTGSGSQTPGVTGSPKPSEPAGNGQPAAPARPGQSGQAGGSGQTGGSGQSGTSGQSDQSGAQRGPLASTGVTIGASIAAALALLALGVGLVLASRRREIETD